jgi:SAM-dependent methyltransferase
MPDPARDYLTLMLNQYWFAPPVALWRAIELRTLASAPFARPILDLGCGDGLIAEVLFAGEPAVAAGFDPWFDQVRKAPQSGAYRAVQQASGGAMPYPDARFATVVSNSVLEHIPQLAPVLRESARVLQPGGRFIATVPSDAFRELLGGYRDRMAAGDAAGADAYASDVDRILEHHRYPSPDEWATMLASAGLELRAARYYVPPDVEALWDEANRAYGIHPDGNPLFRWLASPRLRLLGYQGIVKRWVVRRLGRRWRQAYEMDVPADAVGGGLLILAEKVG